MFSSLSTLLFFLSCAPGNAPEDSTPDPIASGCLYLSL